MARRSRTTISQKITSIYVLIENIKSNESVKTSLFGYGYEESLFNNGETIYTGEERGQARKFLPGTPKRIFYHRGERRERGEEVFIKKTL
jgi:hypothetical protein